MLSPELAWFNPAVPQYPCDPERAAELLAEAGLAEVKALRLFTDEKPVNTTDAYDLFVLSWPLAASPRRTASNHWRSTVKPSHCSWVRVAQEAADLP